MSVEQVIDAYLHMAHQILGDPTTTPAPAPTTTASPDLPHPDWLGDTATSAAAVGAALTQARQQLIRAAADLGAATATATDIRRDAALHLQGITNDWEAAKAALASTPQPLRDSALITEGQQHIAQAMTLISATTARYAHAAAALQDSAAGLPGSPESPTPGLDRPTYPSPPAAPPAAPPPDTLQAAEAFSPMAGLAGDPAAAAIPFMAPMGAPPAAMSALPASAPAMAGPMSSPLPAAAAPLSNLAGLTRQLGSNPLTATPATNSTTRRSRPGSVSEAIDEALDALGITDPAARARWHAGYTTLIARESAGSAHAVNRTDSNARGPIQSDGAPAGSSRGLTQMTPSTFHRYRVPGLSTDIYEPVSNIAASMRYVMDRYHVDPSATNLAANVQQANPRARARGY